MGRDPQRKRDLPPDRLPAETATPKDRATDREENRQRYRQGSPEVSRGRQKEKETGRKGAECT